LNWHYIFRSGVLRYGEKNLEIYRWEERPKVGSSKKGVVSTLLWLGGNGLFVVVKLTKPFLSKLPKDNFWNINVMDNQCCETIAKVRQW